MSKRKNHEEHGNHEAWAIPYGDMVTLLLAFFVVMYSISSVNEGKYRVLSDALSQAFGGPPKSIKPVQIGNHKQSGSDSDQKINIFEKNTVEQNVAGDLRDLRNPVVLPGKNPIKVSQQQTSASGNTGYAEQHAALQHMADAVQKAMGPLIDRNMIIVRKSELKLEIEIRTDILFASGAASVDERARPILEQLAGILKPFPNALRIEGHTDNVPIHTGTFSSNWELSAARAAPGGVLLVVRGGGSRRLRGVGVGEYRPATDNNSAESRNRNRRVVLVVLAETGQPVPVAEVDGGVSMPAAAPAATSDADAAAKAADASAGAGQEPPVAAAPPVPATDPVQ